MLRENLLPCLICDRVYISVERLGQHSNQSLVTSSSLGCTDLLECKLKAPRSGQKKQYLAEKTQRVAILLATLVDWSLVLSPQKLVGGGSGGGGVTSHSRFSGHGQRSSTREASYPKHKVTIEVYVLYHYNLLSFSQFVIMNVWQIFFGTDN